MAGVCHVCDTSKICQTVDHKLVFLQRKLENFKKCIYKQKNKENNLYWNFFSIKKKKWKLIEKEKIVSCFKIIDLKTKEIEI